MLGLLRQIHRWVGLALALPIALVALSGGLLVVRDDYYRVRWPVVAQPRTPAESAVQPRMLDLIEQQYASPGIRIIKFPREGVNAFHVYLADDGEALVDPRTGVELARWHWTSDPAAFLFELHANLMMSARGEVLNGYAALLLVFLSLSGLLLWIPRRTTTFRLRGALPRDLSSAAMLKSHAASGVLLACGVLLFAATGAGLVFYNEFGRIAGAWLDHSPAETPSVIVAPAPGRYAPWRAVLAAVNAALPEAGPTMYYPGTATNTALTFRKSLPGEWHPNGRSYVLVDPYTAHVVQAIDAREQGAGTRLMHALYPVHAAKVGGVAFMVVAFVSGLGLTWLAVGGAWSYGARALRVTRSSRVIGSEEISEANGSDRHGRQEGRPHTHNSTRTSGREQPVAADGWQPRSRDPRELPLPRKDQPLRP